jgi:hypothetical protein
VEVGEGGAASRCAKCGSKRLRRVTIQTNRHVDGSLPAVSRERAHQLFQQIHQLIDSQ